MELYSIIKNDGPGGLLFWKFTGEDFRTGSQLIVAENEEALFVRDGVIVGTFSGGKFDLRTNNYPFIDRMRAAFSGGVGAFSCKVYFINKTHLMELYWGTDSPLQVRDPVWDIATKILARGSYTAQVMDAKKFYLKFVSNNTQAVTPEAVSMMFRSMFMQKIKSLIPKAMREAGGEILGICERQDELAEKMTPVINTYFDEYGLRIVNFYITGLDIPEDEPARAELQMARSSRNRKRLEAMGDSEEIGVLGGNWQRMQARNIMRDVAQNPGSGGVANAGAGLGMGMAAGGLMGSMAAAMISPLAPPVPQPPVAPQSPAVSRFTPKAAPADAGGIECPVCHKKSPGGTKFCGECGAKLAAEKVFCINCGKELAPGAKFCGECGARQS
jgi:membrane protease subunit (stomatin/prohibitin family)